MQESYAQINSLQLCIASWGKGPAVVVSHGWCDHAGSWSTFAECLAAAGYKVVVPDQRGLESQSTVPKAATTTFRIMWLIWLP